MEIFFPFTVLILSRVKSLIPLSVASDVQPEGKGEE